MGNVEQLDFERIAARYVLQRISSEEIQAFAQQCADAGMWSDAIDEIVSARVPIWSDVAPHLATMLASRDVPLPAREDAIAMLIQRQLRDIAKGLAKPYAGMHEIVDLERDSVLPSGGIVGGAYGLQRLIALYWNCQESEELAVPAGSNAETIARIEAEIVALASDWLSRRE